MKDAQWVKSMNEEIDAIEKNHTWDLVDISAKKNKNVLESNGSIRPN